MQPEFKIVGASETICSRERCVRNKLLWALATRGYRTFGLHNRSYTDLDSIASNGPHVRSEPLKSWVRSRSTNRWQYCCHSVDRLPTRNRGA